MQYIKDNQNITFTGFTHNNIVYTAGTLPQLSDEQLTEFGITTQPEPEPIAPEPQYKTIYTPLEFLELFTEQEQLAVVSATLANAQVKLWYDKLLSALEVNIEDERLIAGMGQLVTVGLLTQARADEILTPKLV